MVEEHLQPLLERRASFLRFVERRVHDRALAEDILQAAYTRALQKENELSGMEDPSAIAWFYAVLRHAVIDAYRRRASEGAAMERWKRELGDEEPAAPESPTPGFVCGCIQRVLPELRPAYADLLREVDLAEKPLAEFAARHALKPGNAAVRAHRARAALREALKKFCGSCTIDACLNCICQTPSSKERVRSV